MCFAVSQKLLFSPRSSRPRRPDCKHLFYRQFIYSVTVANVSVYLLGRGVLKRQGSHPQVPIRQRMLLKEQFTQTASGIEAQARRWHERTSSSLVRPPMSSQ